ncbi:hypothetical protein BKA56DRAFT_667612 [Ilyonectria sp. MPI-CAGE-AT-0026]|nr:hypothetical protein BKA56DRAFT_667612 [Ilyonectria sp. MPI-CAGE-AT-0026]
MGLAWLDNRTQIVADADSVDFGADYRNGSNQGPRTPLGFELSQPESRLPQNVSSADATNSLWPYRAIRGPMRDSLTLNAGGRFSSGVLDVGGHRILIGIKDAGRRTQRDMGIAVPGIAGQVEIAPMATTSYSCRPWFCACGEPYSGKEGDKLSAVAHEAPMKHPTFFCRLVPDAPAHLVVPTRCT